MIKKITIKNFKCFKNETVLDLKKTNYKLLEQNTCGKFLKGLLFVGENASGKTSAILPLKLLLDLLFKDQEVEFVLYQCLFSKDKNTELRFEFELETHTISYFLSFSKTAIIEERLSVDDQLILNTVAPLGGALIIGLVVIAVDVKKRTVAHSDQKREVLRVQIAAGDHKVNAIQTPRLVVIPVVGTLLVGKQQHLHSSGPSFSGGILSR